MSLLLFCRVFQEYPNQSVFSVYDGHGGVDAACYTASQLHCNLKKFEKLATQPLEALRFAFTKTDADFIQKSKREVSSIRHFFEWKFLCIFVKNNPFNNDECHCVDLWTVVITS